MVYNFDTYTTGLSIFLKGGEALIMCLQNFFVENIWVTCGFGTAIENFEKVFRDICLLSRIETSEIFFLISSESSFSFNNIF